MDQLEVLCVGRRLIILHKWKAGMHAARSAAATDLTVS